MDARSLVCHPASSIHHHQRGGVPPRRASAIGGGVQYKPQFTTDYVTYFGSSRDLARHEEVRQRLTGMAPRFFGTDALKIHCVQAAKRSEACAQNVGAPLPQQIHAYIEDDKSYRVAFCPEYFALTARDAASHSGNVFQMQTGILLHELTHFHSMDLVAKKRPGTCSAIKMVFHPGNTDLSFREEDCKKDARDDPELAIKNPDNYHFYAFRVLIKSGRLRR